jgi:salicylate hydroxylase
MAIEDAVVLAECLSSAQSLSDIPQLLRLYEQLRMDRVHIVTDGARETVLTWHLPDGPEQQARDAKLLKSAPAKPPEKPSGEQSGLGAGATVKVTAENPNSWSDPLFQPWLFGFDAVADVSVVLLQMGEACPTDCLI